MTFDNPFAKFISKTSSQRISGSKRSRADDDVSLSSMNGTSLKEATSAATAAVSPNAAEVSEIVAKFTENIAPSAVVEVSRPFSRGDEDEDEDDKELRLLLGAPDNTAAQPQSTRPTIAAGALFLGEDINITTPAPITKTAIPLCELPWGTRSNSVLAKIAERFNMQFSWELRRHASLVSLFEPFFSDKALSCIKTGGREPQFLSAPTVTSENTNVAGGYALRSYQVDGVQFLLNKFHAGMSCVLADDMGLGKTAQISAFLHMLKTYHTIEGPHLIVAPLSTLTGWTRELTRWAPTLRVVKYHGEKKGRLYMRSCRGNRHCVFVTTPSIFNQDRGFFRKRAWVVAVVDEAHVLKGGNTMILNVARKLTACFRLAVTGTPVHNSVNEVWNLMSFLYPSYCAIYDIRDDDDHITAAEDCARLLQHIMLRRTKKSIELGIPARVDEPTVMITPTRMQQKLLARMTEEALSGTESNGTRLQVHLTHYRVACSHPLALRLLAAEGHGSGQTGWEQRVALAGVALDEASIIAPSAKMIKLDNLLRECKENGHRCLIFSNFTSVLDLLQAFCVLRGYIFERLDGSTQRVERELSMIRFNSPTSSCFVFLLTTTAGGVGVTLTGADTVILFDAHFNPQIDRQAADRAHRIGQTRVVRVYRFCLSNTIEERILNIALRKASLGDFIVDGCSSKEEGSSSHTLSAAQVRLLFSRDTSASITVGASCQHCESVDTECDALLVDTMVEDLLRVEAEGLPHSSVDRAVSKSTRPGVGTTHKCFVCGEIMRPLEPLYHCTLCPKAYHAECIGERKPKLGVTGPRHWTCPRHSCDLCGVTQGVGDSLFMCNGCPSSFCFDCLDLRYFTLNEAGTEFCHIQRVYPGMEEEGMGVRQSVYYITCLSCCGLTSSSSSSSSSLPSSDDDSDDTYLEVIDDDNGNIFQES